MTSKDVLGRFNSVLNKGNINCTQSELDSFIGYGILLQSNNRYLDRSGNEINVNVIVQKENRFNINLSNLLCYSSSLLKESNTNKLYYMTQHTFNKYKTLGYVIEKGNKSYYRLFDKELWLIHII